MKSTIILLVFIAGNFLSCNSQTSNNAITNNVALKGMAAAANKFLQTLSAKQKEKAQFSFDSEERFNWHFIPKSRKGIPLNDLDATQRKEAMNLLRTALSDTGYNKTTGIMELEGILRGVENRPANDDYR